MSVFQSPDQLRDVLHDVFTALQDVPNTIDTFTRSNLVIRIHLHAPDLSVLLDGRQPPLEVFYGDTPGDANLTASLPADLLHDIWLGQTSARQAFFNGQIQTQGNLMRAVPLLDLFRAAEDVYPPIAAEYGLLDEQS